MFCSFSLISLFLVWVHTKLFLTSPPWESSSSQSPVPTSRSASDSTKGSSRILVCTFTLFFFIVVQVQLSPFSPHCSPSGFVHVSFIHVCWWPCPFIPLLSLPPCPGSCQFVLYFNVSDYILLTCLFCSLGSTYRWDHIVFVFHHLAYFT